MSLPAASIERKPVTYFATALIILAGIAAYFSLGQLEDPNFTVKDAVIITHYPGASPEEVELEVTDRIETKLQELKQIKFVESYSRRGFSYVKVRALPTFWGDDLSQSGIRCAARSATSNRNCHPAPGGPSSTTISATCSVSRWR